MLQKTKINLFVGNHGKTEGIEDYLTSFEYMFTQRGYDFTISEKLQEGAINLVIDEFTNFATNKYIANFVSRRHDAPVVYVLTEFIEKRGLVRSFNHFGGMGNSALLALANLFLRRMRTDFRPAGLGDYLLFGIYLPVLALQIIPLSLDYLHKGRKGWGAAWKTVKRKYFHRFLYMHGRYLGFEAMIGYADAAMMCHPGIGEGYALMQRERKDMPPSLGVFLQEFSPEGIDASMLQDKKRCIEMTGSITSYRHSEKNRINRQIKLLGMSYLLGDVISFGFGDKKPEGPRAAFSIHPPQTAGWPYCSPTRLYRSLVVDHNIPILTKRYGQHPIEDVCLLFNGDDSMYEVYQVLADTEELDSFLSGRVGRYLAIAKTENDHLCDKLVALQQ